jgi:hypothetical protein
MGCGGGQFVVSVATRRLRVLRVWGGCAPHPVAPPLEIRASDLAGSCLPTDIWGGAKVQLKIGAATSRFTGQSGRSSPTLSKPEVSKALPAKEEVQVSSETLPAREELVSSAKEVESPQGGADSTGGTCDGAVLEASTGEAPSKTPGKGARVKW